MDLEVLYEDNHLIAVVKPAGIATQPTDDGQENLQDRVKAWLKDKYAKPGQVFCEPIHRIDKPVSGIVVFAKTSKGLSRMQAAVREGKVTKRYLAKVSPLPQKATGTLEHHLFHGDHRAEIVSKGDPRGQKALLHYQTKGSYLEIDLVTGRYHQIRAQLAAIGSPIIGDRKYGSKEAFQPNQIALHHAKFTLPHPITQEELVLESNPSF